MKFLPDLFLAERAGSDWICQLLWGVLFMYHCATIVLGVIQELCGQKGLDRVSVEVHTWSVYKG